MNRSIIYFLAFGFLAVVLTFAAIEFVDSLDRIDQASSNPDSYTINTSQIVTNNGHVLSCVYKENSEFVYVIGCNQVDGGD